ncbi:MAG: hypothetical protein QG657_4544, partial [Acidobacteriota bacterium]|nr:hypothetical protein [Acidobacteriota bacterium]
DSVWRIKGQLDKYRLEETFHQLIYRHESLRTSFHMVESKPVQKIQSDAIFKIECYDLGPGDQEVECKIEKILQDFVRPFDLSCAPLLRAGLIPLRENEHIFMLDIHHIISDGLSLGVFIKEFMALYKGYPLPELQLQYKDYCQWRNREQQRGMLEKQEKYWLNRYEAEVPALELPYDYPRPIFQSFEGSMVFFQLDQEETAVLKRFVSDESSVLTLYMVLLALFNILLAKLSGNEDIVVGTPFHGRKHIDFQPIIGMFVGTLAMRNYPSPGKTITQFIQEVKENSLAALENQDYPFEELVEKVVVERDTSRNPLFDVMFALQESEIHTSFELEGLSVEPYEHETRVAYFDLFWEVIERAGTLNFILYYCKKLFKIETLNRFFNYFKAIVSATIENPQKKIGEIEIITEEEKKEVLYDFNSSEVDYPQGKTIHRLFEEQVERTPDRIAVFGYGLARTTTDINVGADSQICPITLSYNKLNEQSDRLAHLLIEKGVLADNIVGIMMERSIDLIISILGILKSGGAYLPIDPDYPRERIDYMLKDSAAKILLTAVDCVFNYHHSSLIIHHSNQLSYIIYTSGSTGRPKGVLVEHRSVVNVLFSLFHAYPILPTDSLLMKTSFLFDVSVAELFTWFLGGSRLIVPGKNDHKDPQTLLDIIEKETVTHINFVPSMFGVFISQLNHENIKKLSSLKYIFLAGEALPPEQVAAFRELNNKIVMENLYGPTENTVYTTQYSLSGWSGKGSVPIGKPLSNMQLYVVDWNYCLQPIGVSGELCISGKGLTRGYLNRPELTSNKFIPINRSFWKCRNLFSKRFLPAGGILYRTGDLARWMTDGNIEFLGRIDQQVKIRGYRIELGEIENRLRTHESIKDAIVIDRKDKSGDKYLCAFIVFKPFLEESEPEKRSVIAGVRDYLAGKLPDYMIPAHFVPLESIPLTPSGKVDRKALPTTEPGVGNEYTAPRDEVEERLTGIWSEILCISKNKIGIDNNFFQLGGQSLKLVMLIAQIHKEFDVMAPMSKFFEIFSVRSQAQYIKNASPDKYTSIEAVEKKDYYPMSSAQKRMYILQRINPDNINYNMPLFTTLEGLLEKTRLENAFRELIFRHESLRTSFHLVKNNPVQRVHDKVHFEIRYYEGNAKIEIIKNFVRPFDLSQPSFFRVGLIKTGEENHILLVDMHHAISDGNSLDIFLAELLALYQGKKLPDVRVQYKDYSEWLEKPVILEERQKQEAYWLNRLAGDLPVLKLPTDYPRPKERSFTGALVTFEIPQDTGKKLRALAKREDATMFMVIFSIFNILLFKLSHQEDIIVGTLVAGRRRSELQNIIGMFVNTLALRNYPKNKKTFKEFLIEVKTRALEAFDHQEYPFDDLVEKLGVRRDAARNPLFDVLFLFNALNANEDNKMEIPGLKINPLEEECYQAKFDLLFTGRDSGESENLFFTVEYSTELFKKEKIERFISYFKEIISILEKNESVVALIDIGIEHDLASAASDFYSKVESDFEF